MKMDRSPQVVSRKVADLIPYARNSRTHSDAQIAQIAGSIREFGWTNPVLIDEAGGIVAGHGRVLAARKLGQAEVPCIELAGMSEAQKRAYVIADNKLALNAGWDDELLSLELDDLVSMGFDVGLTGFTQEEIDALRPEIGATTSGAGGPSLADRFMIPPFSVLNAREGWWQDRKRAWLALGIKSEIGRGATGVNSPHEGKGMSDGPVAVRAKQKAAHASPGGSARPAADYSKRQRGDGAGRAL